MSRAIHYGKWAILCGGTLSACFLVGLCIAARLPWLR